MYSYSYKDSIGFNISVEKNINLLKKTLLKNLIF